MKNFTRYISLSILLGLFSSVQGQTYDLSVSAVGTAATAGNLIPAGMVAPLFMTIRNNGANAIPDGTEFWLAIQVNTNYFVQPDTFTFNGAFLAGSEITLTTNAGYSFEASTPSYEICAGAYFTNAALESNAANNYTCETYMASSAVNNDWAAMAVSIASPTNLNGFDIDNYTETVPDIDSVIVILQNNSSITFPGNYGVSYQLALNGDTTNVVGFLAGPLAPGGQTTRIIVNPAIIPPSPQDSGTYSFCAIVNESNDNTDSNNVTCTEFKIIDSYDPFHPSNWPLGADNAVKATLNVVPMLDQVRVEGVSSSTQVTISDMQGKVVRNAVLTEDASFQLTDQASGVYIIKAQDEASGHVEIKKFTNP